LRKLRWRLRARSSIQDVSTSIGPKLSMDLDMCAVHADQKHDRALMKPCIPRLPLSRKLITNMRISLVSMLSSLLSLASSVNCDRIVRSIYPVLGLRLPNGADSGLAFLRPCLMKYNHKLIEKPLVVGSIREYGLFQVPLRGEKHQEQLPKLPSIIPRVPQCVDSILSRKEGPVFDFANCRVGACIVKHCDALINREDVDVEQMLPIDILPCLIRVAESLVIEPPIDT